MKPSEKLYTIKQQINFSYINKQQLDLFELDILNNTLTELLKEVRKLEQTNKDESLSRQIRELNQEHAEKFVKYGGNSLEFKRYCIEVYNPKLDKLNKLSKGDLKNG